jgi:S-methylmethionine-dependent homocysteine/selenocysteine methylase
MTKYGDELPQLDADLFLTDGGIETTLIFDDGLELPDFAAFILLDAEQGRAALCRYFQQYIDIAGRDGLGIVLETPTWRASPDWTERQGYDTEGLRRLNREAVQLLVDLRSQNPAVEPIVVSGCIGPRGDGYRPDALMTSRQAQAYHSLQAEVFAASGADVITAITMTYPAEAIGVTEAARATGMPVVISFTLETDGTLPAGGTLRDAIEAVDRATGAYPSYYMVNCAHPTHFADVLVAGESWTTRLGGIRANASVMSHAELDEAEVLDTGDPDDLARRYVELRRAHPHITVVGGCCGTSHHHVGAISAACTAGVRS